MPMVRRGKIAMNVRLWVGDESAMVHADHTNKADLTHLRSICGTFLGRLGPDGRTLGYDRTGIVVDEPATCLWCVAERRMQWR